MKLTEKVVVFNAQLLGMFIEVKGTGYDGRELYRRGIITEVRKDHLKMAVVQTAEHYAKTTSFETQLHYKDFFKKETVEGEEDQTFYELYVFTESKKVEVDENAPEE